MRGGRPQSQLFVGLDVPHQPACEGGYGLPTAMRFQAHHKNRELSKFPAAGS